MGSLRAIYHFEFYSGTQPTTLIGHLHHRSVYSPLLSVRTASIKADNIRVPRERLS